MEICSPPRACVRCAQNRWRWVVLLRNALRCRARAGLHDGSFTGQYFQEVTAHRLQPAECRSQLYNFYRLIQNAGLGSNTQLQLLTRIRQESGDWKWEMSMSEMFLISMSVRTFCLAGIQAAVAGNLAVCSALWVSIWTLDNI